MTTGTDSHLREDATKQSFRNIVLFCLCLVAASVAVELLGLNRFLRAWIQGSYFLSYVGILIPALAICLGPTLVRKLRAQQVSATSFFWTGLLLGLPCGLLAVLLSPALLGEGFGPALKALKHVGYLATAAALSLGWLYGAIAAVFFYFLLHDKRRLGVAVVVVLTIGALQVGLLIHFHKTWW